jgi:hypothetical protein
LVDRCDTCGRLSELFQLPGRKDRNCTDCNADISILVLLYRRLENAQLNDEDLTKLEAQIVPFLHGFLERSELQAHGSGSTHSCLLLETVRTDNHRVN